ncbi:sulfotransferase family protein [Streptomyces sp. NPDC057690]|uniref:sulfotransferase-like domain-containing protein n=1 Tax=Streptomyces sp. NPDC057690 TaxID=3346214 RepID=UPI0036756C95
MRDQDSVDRPRPLIIALWSAPRSRSTAFLKMMMERDDVVTLHEPFCRLADFGEAEVGSRTVRTEADLIAAIRELAQDTTVFFKDTTDFRYPGVLADQAFLREVAHTFIIRDPREVIASHYALNPELKCDDVGFSRLHELYLAVAEAQGSDPLVIDSDDLLDHTEEIVRTYCERTGLTFRPDTLRWNPGIPKDWQLTERWHVDAGNSSGFTRKPKEYTDTVDNHTVLADYYRQQFPFYQYLYDHRAAV